MDGPRFQASRWSERLFRDHGNRGYTGQTGTDLTEWQRSLRNRLRETLGFPRIATRGTPPLAAKRLEVVPEPGYERQKWIIRTEPGFWVPFYVLLPDSAPTPLPVVLAVHGHGPIGKELYVGRYQTEEQRAEKIAAGERDIAVQAVKRGYAAIVPDMRGFGELADAADQHDGTNSCRTLQLHAQLVGRSLTGDRVWDVRRLIDFVEDREEFDQHRIAITGNSSGGYVSLFAAAADERIAVTVPGSTFCTFAASIGSIHHCTCGYVPGLLELGEMWDIAGLTAPRPFLAVNGEHDGIVPIEGAQTAFAELQRIYDASDAPEHCGLYVGGGGHRYYKDAAWSFIETHL